MIRPFQLEAVVAAGERPALVAAAQQLSEALRAAAGVDWPIELRLRDAGTQPAAAANSIVILSLLPEVESAEPLAAAEARWRARLSALAPTGAPVLLMTVFRHLADRTSASGAVRLERIRRLNGLALTLSQDLHADVIDIDRAFAHIGARTLKTDYRLGGRLAAEVAAHGIVLAILSLGLDELIPIETQQRARAFHGSLRDIDKLVNRRLNQAARA
jgi:hypothetical protein